MEAVLTDATLTMFDKMLGAAFRRADRAHKDNLVDRARTLDASARVLLGMAKAMLAAKEKGEDQVSAVERSLGWERLKILVAVTESAVADSRPDNLGEIVKRYASLRRMSPVIFGAFVFRSWKEHDPLLTALDVVRELHASGAKKLPPRAPMGFLRPIWRKVVKTDAGTDRRAYEVAVMMALRERLRSGDVWVEGSRAFRAFDDFLLPRDAFENWRDADELGLAVPDRFEDWRDDKAKRLETRLREVDALTAAGDLPEASLTEEGLSISPIRAAENEAVDHRHQSPPCFRATGSGGFSEMAAGNTTGADWARQILGASFSHVSMAVLRARNRSSSCSSRSECATRYLSFVAKPSSVPHRASATVSRAALSASKAESTLRRRARMRGTTSTGEAMAAV